MNPTTLDVVGCVVVLVCFALACMIMPADGYVEECAAFDCALD